MRTTYGSTPRASARPTRSQPTAAGRRRPAGRDTARLSRPSSPRSAGRPVGLVGTVESDLPPGAGLSSSAALEVAIGLALCTVAEFELEPLELALACQRAELRAVGVPCGILDQAACLLGRAGSALLLDCCTLEHRLVSLPAEAAFVIVDSGVERSLETSAYAKRRAELEHAMRLVGAERSTDVRLEALDLLDAVSLRRLRHVVTENDACPSLRGGARGRRVRNGRTLLRASHASLRDDYEVSIGELDLLVELADAAGAYGARMIGGGFGGAILALVEAAQAGDVERSVVAEYQARSGRTGRAHTVVASAGAYAGAAR